MTKDDLRLIKTRSMPLALLALFGLGSTHAPVQADERPNRTAGVNFVGGLPELLGVQFTYQGFRSVVFGMGFGALPINALVNRAVKLSSMPLTMTSGGPYEIVPSASYSLSQYSFFAKVFPWNGNFFVQTGYASLNASGSLVGDLRNESTGGSTAGAMTGTVRFTQPVVQFAVGWDFLFSSGIFFNAGVGASYLMVPSSTVAVGGAITNFIPLDPAAEQSFEEAKASIRSQVETGVQSIRGVTRFFPSVFIGVGWAFDFG